MNKKVAYGAMATIAVIALVIVIEGVLALASAQSTDNETYGQDGQVLIAPSSFKVGTWFKWRWGPSSRLIQVSPEYNQ